MAVTAPGSDLWVLSTPESARADAKSITSSSKSVCDGGPHDSFFTLGAKYCPALAVMRGGNLHCAPHGTLVALRKHQPSAEPLHSSLHKCSKSNVQVTALYILRVQPYYRVTDLTHLDLSRESRGANAERTPLLHFARTRPDRTGRPVCRPI